MTQQTHPGETEQGTGDDQEGTSRTTAGSADEQGGRREPMWYEGPSTWQAPGSASGHDFGLDSPARDDREAPASREQSPHSSGHDGSAFGAGATAGATGWPTAEVPVQWHPEAGAPTGGNGWNGDGGWGGPHQWNQPAPAPKARPGRRLAELGVVAVLAAALAGGATFGAIKLTGTDSVAGSSTTSTTTTPAPVVQADASNPDWSATAKAVAPSVVSITVTSQQAEGQGSGVIIDTAGHILTNNHVATGAGTGATISVTLDDGRTYGATIVGTDPTTDLAVLKVQNGPSDLKPISIGDSSTLAVGQPVMAVGNPLGLAGTVTTGIVSALDRPVTTAASESDQSQQSPFGGSQGQQGSGGSSQDQSSQDVVTNAIQTSAAINPGNSGGALVTANGQLIGINSSIASLGSSSSSGSQSGNIGIGFAIPVKEAKPIADQLIQTGTAQHAYLGVSASDTTVTDGSSKRAAALLRDVSTGTPAASAGLKANDAVIAINGDSIESSESLVATIHEYAVGEKVTVTVIRGGAKQDIQVTLAARPGQG